MSENKDRKIILAKSGIFNDLVTRIKLVVRLIGDTRINPLLKLLPIGALAYFIIPDLVIGPIDDAAVMWLGGYLFDISGTYISGFILSIVSIAMACICFWVAAPRRGVGMQNE